MTTQDHYAEAQRLGDTAEALNDNGCPADEVTAIATLAHVHATLALVDAIRDASTAHVHDVVTPVLGGTPIRDTTTTGRPA